MRKGITRQILTSNHTRCLPGNQSWSFQIVETFRQRLKKLYELAELKGTPRPVARQRALVWLERVELADWAGHKVKDLSRGMQQKLQLVVSLVHDPELLVLDEPFQGLDPVNVDLLKTSPPKTKRSILWQSVQANGSNTRSSAPAISSYFLASLCSKATGSGLRS